MLALLHAPAKAGYSRALDAITEVTFTRSHLGKAAIYDLLKVRFSVDGRSASIAWYLKDPAAWKSKIEGLRTGRR